MQGRVQYVLLILSVISCAELQLPPPPPYPAWTSIAEQGLWNIQMLFDLQQNPLQISTDSTVGSGSESSYIRLFKESGGLIGGIKLTFGDPIEWSIGYCCPCDNTLYPLTAPDQPVHKTWTLQKTADYLTIHCNGELSLNFTFADSTNEKCVNRWTNNATSFMLRGGDRATDQLRLQPTECTDIPTDWLNVIPDPGRLPIQPGDKLALLCSEDYHNLGDSEVTCDPYQYDDYQYNNMPLCLGRMKCEYEFHEDSMTSDPLDLLHQPQESTLAAAQAHCDEDPNCGSITVDKNSATFSLKQGNVTIQSELHSCWVKGVCHITAIIGLADKQYIALNETFAATCTAFGSPTTTISWTLNGLAVDESLMETSVFDVDANSITSAMEVVSVTLSDDGNYHCLHSIDANYNNSLVLDVYAISVTDKEVQAGAPVELECSVHHITAPVTFQWTNSSADSVPSNDGLLQNFSQTSTITVTPLVDDVYYCYVTAINEINAIVHVAHLKVFDITTTDDEVAKGMSGTVKCTVRGMNQQVSIAFKDGDQIISSEEGVTLIDQGTFNSQDTSQNATLVIESVAADKTYTCVVTSGEYPLSGGQEMEVSVVILDINISPSTTTQDVSSSLDLICTGRGPSSITIQWSTSAGDLTPLANEAAYNSENKTIASTLTLPDISVQDAGTYTCFIQFGEGESVAAEAQLIVNLIYPDTLSQHVVIGGTFVAQCKAYGPPDTSITWQFNEEALINEGSVNVTGFAYDQEAGSIVSELEVAAVTLEEEGLYYCTHSLALVRGNTTLDVYDISVSNKEVRTNTPVNLTCTVTGITSPVQFQWITSAAEAVPSTDSNLKEDLSQTSMVTLTPALDDVYYCYVTDPDLGGSPVIRAAVLNVFDMTTESAYVGLYTPANMSCTARGTSQQVSISFKDGDQVISSEEGVSLFQEGSYNPEENSQTATLFIESVAADKTYTCVVTSGEYPLSGGYEMEVSVVILDSDWEPVPKNLYKSHDLTEHPLQLRYLGPFASTGLVKLALFDAAGVSEVINLLWYQDTVVIRNVCSGAEVHCNGTYHEQVLTIARTDAALIVFCGSLRVGIPFSDCGEGLSEAGMIYKMLDFVAGIRNGPDCDELLWPNTTTTPLLPANYNAVLEVGCAPGYFNRADQYITCVTENLYVFSEEPACKPQPYDVTDALPSRSLTLTSSDTSPDLQLLSDDDLRTHTRVVAVDESGPWIKLELNGSRHISDIIVYSGFYTDWYDPGYMCVQNESNYLLCKERETAVSVELFRGPTKQKTCGVLELSSGLSGEEQVYQLICGGAGDTVLLSKPEGEIVVYEVVIKSRDCPVLQVEHGVVARSATDNTATVLCNEGYHLFGDTITWKEEKTSSCINGNWSPRPHCLPTCNVTTCAEGQLCRELHALPQCYAGCGEPTAPLNGTIVSFDEEHAVMSCDEGFELLGAERLSCLEGGFWEHGTWCQSVATTEVLAISPVFNATRLIKVGSWGFTATCPPGFLVKSCICYETQDFPGNCKGSQLNESRTACLFANAARNNLANMQGIAVCALSFNIRDPCDVGRWLPFQEHLVSAASPHPAVSCNTTTHPTPEHCNALILTGNPFIRLGNGLPTSQVELAIDGSCSTLCFEAGKGTCVLTLRCTAWDMLRNSSLYKLEHCPTCSHVTCNSVQYCVMEDNIPQCYYRCTDLDIADGNFTSTRNDNDVTIATITCNYKHYISRNATLYCGRDGIWTGGTGRCVPHTCSTWTCSGDEYCTTISSTPFCRKSCPDFSIENAVVTRDNKTATVTCPHPQYSFSGTSAHLTCLSDGRWSDVIPACLPALCEVVNCTDNQYCLEEEGLALCRPRCPPLLPSLGLSVSASDTRMVVRCTPGFYLVGSAELSCLESGDWDDITPTCRPMCPKPARTTDGTRHITFTTLQTACDQGFVLVGSQTRTCQETGTWDGTLATCQPASCSQMKCPGSHSCNEEEGYAQCRVFSLPEFTAHLKNCFAGSLSDECEYELLEAEQFLAEDDFLSVLGDVVQETEFNSASHAQLVVKVYLDKITEREENFTDENREGIRRVIARYDRYIRLLTDPPTIVQLVGLTMRLVNSALRSLMIQENAGLGTRNTTKIKEVWIAGYGCGESSIFLTERYASFLRSLRNTTEQLIDNL